MKKQLVRISVLRVTGGGSVSWRTLRRESPLLVFGGSGVEASEGSGFHVHGFVLIDNHARKRGVTS